jgi:cell division protein FtsZ
MEREVKITLVATGFASKTGLAGESQEDEFAQLLKGLKTEDELDVPSFLRRPLFSHRRQTISQAVPIKVVKPPVQTPIR